MGERRYVVIARCASYRRAVARLCGSTYRVEFCARPDTIRNNKTTGSVRGRWLPFFT